MSKETLLIETNERNAALVYDTDNWTLTCKFTESNTVEFVENLDNIKNIYKKSSYTETHTEQKNKVARTIIGGALFGVTGAIVGAVSGEGDKVVKDATYSFLHIETYDNKEYVVVCKESPLFNNSWFFITNLLDLIKSKNDECYQKRKKIGAIYGVICLAIIVLAILVCLMAD